LKGMERVTTRIEELHDDWGKVRGGHKGTWIFRHLSVDAKKKDLPRDINTSNFNAARYDRVESLRWERVNLEH